jgi:hypothetical protein
MNPFNMVGIPGFAVDNGALNGDARMNQARRNFKTENKTVSG